MIVATVEDRARAEEMAYTAVSEVYEAGTTKLKSDAARASAVAYATAASFGWISNVLPTGIVTDCWRVTGDGLAMLEEFLNAQD